MNGAQDRQLAFERHAHAFAHVSIGLPAGIEVALCPYCLLPFGLGDTVTPPDGPPAVNVEHAPPRLGGRLGEPRAMCLAHTDCQSTRFEAKAGMYLKDIRTLKAGGTGKLPGFIDGNFGYVMLANGAGGVRPVGVQAGTEIRLNLTFPDEVQLSELKAAYAVAFAALGYSWLARPGVDRVRAAITSGDIALLGYRPLAVIQDPSPEAANTVLVDQSMIVVVGDDPGYGLVLPNGAIDEAELQSSVQVGGYLVPWLPNSWWRARFRPLPAFRLDCELAQPLWKMELAEPA